jgi:long-chain acyl-CoA synthetase
MQTLVELFENTVERYPDKIALHDRGNDWTYRQIADRAACTAAWLRKNGFKPQERVGLLVPNSLEYVVAYFGILLAGGIVVAVKPDTTSRELVGLLTHCGAAAIVADTRYQTTLSTIMQEVASIRLVVLAGKYSSIPALPKQVGVLSQLWQSPEQIADCAPVTCRDIAQIIYTSGTTGSPKGVTLSHTNLVANCASIVQYLELNHDDSVFVILPFYYSYGNSLLLSHIAVGGRLILTPDFVFWNRALDVMQTERATGFSGVPSSYAMLLHKSNFETRELPHLRYMTCAGGALPTATTKRLRSAFPQVDLFLMYGQTEASARLSTLMPNDVDSRPGSIGKEIPGVKLTVLNKAGQQVQVGEVGEIVANGDNVMVGYWNEPEQTALTCRPDGLHTGDLAKVDWDGYLYLVGRKSEMIKCGSYRIAPQEIEEILMELPGVADAAVAGIPDEILCEVPIAFVVKSDAGEGLTEREVLNHCGANLPRHKMIHRVHFVTSLPRTSTGKLRRSELCKRIAEHPHPEEHLINAE